MKTKVIGSSTHPEYAMRCNDCSKEFKMRAAREDIEKAVCPVCGKDHIAIVYISFPTDGPGFQEGYDAAQLV